MAKPLLRKTLLLLAANGLFGVGIFLVTDTGRWDGPSKAFIVGYALLAAALAQLLAASLLIVQTSTKSWGGALLISAALMAWIGFAFPLQ